MLVLQIQEGAAASERRNSSVRVVCKVGSWCETYILGVNHRYGHSGMYTPGVTNIFDNSGMYALFVTNV
jgi:hypothetical protein